MQVLMLLNEYSGLMTVAGMVFGILWFVFRFRGDMESWRSDYEVYKNSHCSDAKRVKEVVFDIRESQRQSQIHIDYQKRQAEEMAQVLRRNNELIAHLIGVLEQIKDRLK